MNKELQLLLEIKSSFDWPVDSFRYGISSERRYIYSENSSNELSKELVERVRFSLAKVKIAAHQVSSLKKIPWISMIFITGSVASLNANEDDDIDIWLIVEPKRIWLTRALDFFLFTVRGKRRLSSDGVESKKVKDKFCFNYYSTTESLELPEKSISFAMQFVDAIPVFIREQSMYQQLIEKNAWISKFFPSWYAIASKNTYEILLDSKKRPNYAVEKLFDAVEYIAGFLMVLKAEKRITFKKEEIYRKMFTTWGTPRILSRYDQETFTESSQKG